MELYSETLRLELLPFDVKVLLVVAGGVKTVIGSNTPRPALQEGSLYRITEAEKNREFDTGNENSFLTADVFAERVVSDAVRGKTGRTWRGKFSTVMEYFVSLMPRWALVSHCERRWNNEAVVSNRF